MTTGKTFLRHAHIGVVLGVIIGVVTAGFGQNRDLGKQADVLVIDMHALNFAPVLQPVEQIVFNGQPQNVQWVFVAGRVLKAKGKLKGVDVGKLIKAAQIATDHIAPALQP